MINMQLVTGKLSSDSQKIIDDHQTESLQPDHRATKTI